MTLSINKICSFLKERHYINADIIIVFADLQIQWSKDHWIIEKEWFDFTYS